MEAEMSRMLQFARLMKSQKGLSPGKVLSYLFHLPSLLRLIARLLRDHRVPARLKLYCGLAVAYFLMPFDFVPDFLLPLFGLGMVDDLSLLVLAFAKLVKDAPQDVVDEHVREISGPQRAPAEGE
jgi:uncharacterized membrane protein YkvA (DUF1232 family)